MAEFMAAVASESESESEAEAMIGAATLTMIKPRDRAALRAALPHMIRGAAISRSNPPKEARNEGLASA